MLPPAGYLRGVRDLCDRFGIVFIADEVMAGFGRAGRWFAIEHAGVVSDLLTFAKGVNSGLRAARRCRDQRRRLRHLRPPPYPGGLTYSGHPLACAAAVAAIAAMEDEKVVDHAARLGEEVFEPGLRELAAKHPWVGEARGTRAFWAIELVRDPETKEPLAPYGGSSPEMAAITAACKRNGLLPFSNFNRILVPPLTTTAGQVREAIGTLDAALTEVAAPS